MPTLKAPVAGYPSSRLASASPELVPPVLGLGPWVNAGLNANVPFTSPGAKTLMPIRRYSPPTFTVWRPASHDSEKFAECEYDVLSVCVPPLKSVG